MKKTILGVRVDPEWKQGAIVEENVKQESKEDV